MTLDEIYYELIGKVNDFLIAEGETARCLAFGINPAQQKPRGERPKYPYFQMHFPTNIDRPPHTTRDSKIITWFDLQMNYYAAAKNEQFNVAALTRLYHKVMNAIQDTRVQIWRDLASLQRITGPTDIAYREGSVKVSFATTFRLVAICSYVLEITPYVDSSVDSALAVVNGALSGEYD